MRRTLFYAVSVLVILADQLSKWAVVTHLQPYVSTPLLPFLKLTLAYNTGAAFSLLDDAGDWHLLFFVFFSLSVSFILVVWLWRVALEDLRLAWGLSFILGGALGNVIDRLHYGYVIDFISVYYAQYHFPIFNVADAAISIGAALILLDFILNAKKKPTG